MIYNKKFDQKGFYDQQGTYENSSLWKKMSFSGLYFQIVNLKTAACG